MFCIQSETVIRKVTDDISCGQYFQLITSFITL